MTAQEGTERLIRQIIHTLQNLDNVLYTRPLPVLNGATLGQHFRHIQDFYNCLTQCANTDILDYACRERNPAIETDIQSAINAFTQLNTTLSGLNGTKTITVLADYSDKNTTDRPAAQSSVGRELMYAYDHAIHHLAMIKIGLQAACPAMDIDPDLGVAPSTIRYRETNEG